MPENYAGLEAFRRTMEEMDVLTWLTFYGKRVRPPCHENVVDIGASHNPSQYGECSSIVHGENGIGMANLVDGRIYPVSPEGSPASSMPNPLGAGHG